MSALTISQISDLVREAQIAFCLDKFPNFEVALVRKTEAALAPMQAEAPQAGWKLVPVEPTLEMCLADWNVSMSDAHSETGTSEAAWRAMLNAAPEAPQATDWMKVNGVTFVKAPQATKDAERLDWIIRQADEFSCSVIVDAPGDGDYLVGGMGAAQGRGKTAREAIDAARKSQGEATGTPTDAGGAKS